MIKGVRSILLVLTLIASFSLPIETQTVETFYGSGVVGVDSLWRNNPDDYHPEFADGSIVNPILSRPYNYACGFYCTGSCNVAYFAIFTLYVHSWAEPFIPQVLWSANRNFPVRINSTLELKSDGNLVLKDANGTIAWSSNTSGKSVVAMNFTDFGNLVLLDKENSVVWDSFDHPTDTLLISQKLKVGQKLTASVSSSNLSEGLYVLSMNRSGMFAFLNTEPPQVYCAYISWIFPNSTNMTYVEFQNGSLALSLSPKNGPYIWRSIPLSLSDSLQYMKLSSDGHFRVYDLLGKWQEIADIFSDSIGVCEYPTVCGQYGICSSNGQCNCPSSTNHPNGSPYFKLVNDRQRNLGCFQIIPLSCAETKYQSFMELKNVSYFGFSPDLVNVNPARCKGACASNCSCKAAFFRHRSPNSNYSSCSLQSEVFSLMDNGVDDTAFGSIAYVKVQNVSDYRRKGHGMMIVGTAVGSSFVLIALLTLLISRKRGPEEAEEDSLDQVPGMPSRFSYSDLKSFTENFSKKLGQGGFGSVFEGTLVDGTKIAVKCLSGLGRIKKSFFAEVETIGKIHHVNLVSLLGFCVEKSESFLVYEHMANGSLDKWIFHRKSGFLLTWQKRKKIILGIAKGLSYLHEDCWQKIIHLDIKPQNILLDCNFNAKVSDFGLSKLINRDQSQLVTTMRGTPGYLAPEWLSSRITEKVDVYSFGVVVLEIVCGRGVFDSSENEEDMHLLRILQRKAEEGRLIDLADKLSDDMHLHELEVVKMLKLSAWCLQADYMKRPSMSVITMVLEGVMDVEEDVDYVFWNYPAKINRREDAICDATPLLPSVLSEPR